MKTPPKDLDSEAPVSAGSNELLRDGAVPILASEDVCLALNLITLPARRESQRALDILPEETSYSEARTPASLPRRTTSPAGVARKELAVSLPVTAPSRTLSPVQQRLVDCLTHTPQHIDALSQKSGLTAVQAGVELTLLELDGLVRRLPGNTYISAR